MGVKGAILGTAILSLSAFASSLNPPACFTNGFWQGYRFGYEQGVSSVKNLRGVNDMISTLFTAIRLLKEKGYGQNTDYGYQITITIPSKLIGQFSFLKRELEVYKRLLQEDKPELGGWVVELPTENLSKPQIGWAVYRSLQAGVEPIVKGGYIIFGAFGRKADAKALAQKLQAFGIPAQVKEVLND